MREFTTAVEQSQPDTSDEVQFKVDGRECKAYQPNDGQFAMFMAMTGRHADSQDQIAGIINFFLGLLDDDSQHYITGKLMDRKDPFGIEQVQEIMEFLSEEWAARPTQPPSGSTSSPPSTGPSSTPSTPALT